MHTQDFFRTVLPETGPYHIVVLKKDSKPGRKSCATIEELAAASLKLDANPDNAVYFGCASGTPPQGKQRVTAESPDGKAKALWIDIDCGEEKAASGKGYESKNAAITALAKFCTDNAFPFPMVVDSGGGLHCYWPLTKALPYQHWFALASAFKKLIAANNLLADNAVTADFARILRAPGTTNRKKEPREVKVRREVRAFTPQEIQEHLKRLRAPSDLPHSKQNITDDLNDDLTAHVKAYIDVPTSAELVATKCAQVAKMRDTLGDVGYDHWRGVVGLIKYCTEGISLARAWSARREETGHAQNDVLTRYETWNAGPPTCAFFEEKNPGGCKGCPHEGKIKTPKVLGTVAVEETAPTTAEAIVDGKKETVEIPPLPKGYKWDEKEHVLLRAYEDADGIMHYARVCHSRFYPTYRVKREDGTFGVGIRMHLPDGRIRDFDIDTGLLASTTKLMEALGHKGEIVQVNTKDAGNHMTAYLRDSLEKLKREAEEVSTYSSFGWKSDMQSFLIGDRLYLKDGTTRRVLVGGMATSCLHHFPAPKGTVEGYAAALNRAYNVPGMVPLQYAICSGFGSVITPFGETLYRGLAVAVTSETSGLGKSSVCYAALYGFGDPQAIRLTSEAGATWNAMYSRFGVYGCLPMLIDELTNIEPKDFSKFVYLISEGKDKSRIVSSGGNLRMAEQNEWWLPPYIGANTDLHALLSQSTANSQAEAVRMIQIKIEDYPDIPRYKDGDSGLVETALTQMRMNQGAAGEAIIKYCVTHTNEVFSMVQETLAEIGKLVGDQKYRFFRNHAACTLVSCRIMNLLGIADFDYDTMFRFSIGLMRKLCKDVMESNTITPEDAFDRMVNDLRPRILNTDEYRDGRDARGPEYGKRSESAHQSFAGRYIHGAVKEPLSGRMYLVQKEMKDWCGKQRVSFDSVLSYARAGGFLVSERERFNLTRGTSYPAMQITCVVFDMHAKEGITSPPKLVLHTSPTPPNVDSGQKAAI